MENKEDTLPRRICCIVFYFLLHFPSVMVNFMYQLGWVQNVQIAGKTLCLVVSMRVFLKDISIWISRLKKESSHEWALSNLLGVQID
jgi:hypothetical protein